MHAVRYDPQAGLLRLRMTGFWTIADVERFTVDLLATVGRIPDAERNFDVLSETMDFPVQSAEVADALGRIMDAADQMNKTGRKAIIVGSMINKLQAERALARPNVRIFRTEAEAQAWLAEPGAEPA